MSIHASPPPSAIHPEVVKCWASAAYFIDRYVSIYDAAGGSWIPFRLWPAQLAALISLERSKRLIALKARQVGLTWLALSYALWRMLFRPAATVLLFSRRQEEAVYLLSDERLRGTYARLPHWLRLGEPKRTSACTWELPNGSVAHAFPTTAGDSYTAALAIVDEADLVPDLERLLRSVKPTIDAGGRLVLVSRVDKSRIGSPFQRLFREASGGGADWRPVFLPWQARPQRDEAWYAAMKQDVVARTGSLDELFEQYPATAEEALAGRTLDKRLPREWLEACFVAKRPLPLADLPPAAPAWPGLAVYVLPARDRRYVLGVDPAEGNPTSDDSALTVLDAATGAEAVALAGRLEPAVFAAAIDEIARFYNGAAALVERNNHGHAVLLWLRDHGKIAVLPGEDGRPGWNSTSAGKPLLFARAGEALRSGEPTLHTRDTFEQLLSIEGATMRAPAGQADDRAMSWLLALEARRICFAPPLVLPLPHGRLEGGIIERAPPGVFLAEPRA
jgi:hypothetical protein